MSIVLALAVPAIAISGARPVAAASSGTISIGSVTVVEGDSGTRLLRFPVTLSVPATNTVTVQYTVRSASATVGPATGTGVDVIANDGAPTTLTFAVSTTTHTTPAFATIAIAISGDTDVEPDEAFTVTLSNPTGGYTLGQAIGIGTILNDDSAATAASSALRVSAGDVTVAEGNSGSRTVWLPVTLSAPAGATTITVPYAAHSDDAYRGTLRPGNDYSGPLHGILSFSGSTVIRYVPFKVYGNAFYGSDKAITVTLGTPNVGAVAKSTGTLTILDDDVAPRRPASNPFVTPGSVGYLAASMPALTIYDRQPTGTNVVIGGSTWTWQAYGLRNNDDNPAPLAHVRVNGPLYWTGNGTLAISQSVIDARPPTYGGSWTGAASIAVGGHGCDARVVTCTATQHAAISVTDTTVLGIAPSGQDVPAVHSLFTGVVNITRSDISGYPQGADPGDGSVITQSYFHSLRQPVGTTTAHQDGVFVEGNNVVLRQNFIDGSLFTATTAGIFIQHTGDMLTPYTGIVITDNFVAANPGFPYAIRNQSGATADVERNTLAAGQGITAEQLSTYPRGTFTATSTNNVSVDGSTVPIGNLNVG